MLLRNRPRRIILPESLQRKIARYTFAVNAKTDENDIRALAVELKAVTDGIKKTAEEAQAQVKATGAVAEETKKKADELLAKQSDIDGRLRNIEQRLARRPGESDDRKRSLGEITVAHEDVKAFMAKKPRGSVKIDIRAAITSLPASAGDLVEPDRRPGVIELPRRRFTIRQLLTPGRTTSNLVEYVKETGFTNNAAPVTEGAQKPESNITFDLTSAPVRTIAHFIHASKQILDDAAGLQSIIDGRLRYGLEYVEETQLLLGDGTGQNLHGIVPQATAYSAAFAVTNETEIDVLRLALLQTTLAEYDADGIVLHPTDWARIELTKDTQGRYIFANPQGIAGPTMWGRPVVPTQAMTEDEFLVGAFRLAAQIFDREDANVEISTEDRDNFIKNMVTVRGEERLAFAVYRPEAFVTGDFGNVSP